MKYCDAKKLHNEDEVRSKDTGEKIRVLSTELVKDAVDQKFVKIEGIGTRSGHGCWYHIEVD
jgi:hypothetical protein